MHIQDFFQNFLKLFLVGLHGDCTISLIAQDMSPPRTAPSPPPENLPPSRAGGVRFRHFPPPPPRAPQTFHRPPPACAPLPSSSETPTGRPLPSYLPGAKAPRPKLKLSSPSAPHLSLALRRLPASLQSTAVALPEGDFGGRGSVISSLVAGEDG